MKTSTAVASALLAAAPILAQQPVYAQCGGINWTGGTTCATGNACIFQNDYYSQCLPGVASTTTARSVSSVTPVSTLKASTVASSSTSVKVVASSTTSSKTVASSSPASGGATYKASFTFYGSNDDNGSGNCQVSTTACGFYTSGSKAFTAAASQNLFGVGPGAGAGPACGTCWALTAETDSSGNTLSNAGNTIVVMVNNLCPADGNPLCSQSSLTSTNQYGANVDFDLCSNSGAETAMFGSDGVGLAVGTATEVSCSEWSGTEVH